MNTFDTRCDEVQQAIAIKQSLSDAQTSHIEICEHCTALQIEFRRLDDLLEQSMIDEVPAGFADRVMAQITAISPQTQAIDDQVVDRLLAAFYRSRLLQSLLLGLGIAMGVGHIVRFFLGLFITSMAAAL
ncbi:MAG: hypothetical protein OEY67_09455 [Gammaproteobacteria bacterium]|nr:hypothetical protein [Gammaproteobacteria bacterium]